MKRVEERVAPAQYSCCCQGQWCLLGACQTHRYQLNVSWPHQIRGKLGGKAIAVAPAGCITRAHNAEMSLNNWVLL